MVANLLENLAGFMFNPLEDSWWWKLEDDGIFSVNSLYKKLIRGGVEDEELREEENKVLAQIWKSPAPSKVVAFSWKLLLNKLPTRLNLLRRNCSSPESSVLCVLCNSTAESVNHLFLHCEVASEVWKNLMRWLGFNFITPSNLFRHWDCWNGEACNKHICKWFWLIWHASIWSL